MTNGPFDARTGPFRCLFLINAFSRYCNPLKDFLSSRCVEFHADKPTFAFCVLAPK